MLHSACSRPARHLQGFINFLSTAEEREVDSENEDEYGATFGVNADCPIFPGLFNFCTIYAGASVGAPRTPLAAKHS
jgi:acetoin utilization deacetylase AcuC-like enzyme